MLYLMGMKIPVPKLPASAATTLQRINFAVPAAKNGPMPSEGIKFQAKPVATPSAIE